ncbi:MAG: sigma-54 dependent transcriptional regulator [Aquificaceae bacterium]|nr:sigma-54 dependent transcriptional regulator [Aquificaceae bacterium]
MPRVLVVDDEQSVLLAIGKVLSKHGYETITLSDTANLQEHVERADLLIMDIRLTGGNGVELVEELRAKGYNLPVVFITAYTDPDMIIRASRLGAVDVLKKPFGADDLLRAVKTSLYKAPSVKTLLLEPRGVVFASKEMFEVIKQTGVASGCDMNVLITGETGTGKEVIARLIHANSKRKDAPFVALNCSAIPKDLFEAELFGHTKGAFTGASFDKKGKVEQAQGGTLFLDEVGELPYGKQAKLLRFIEEKTFYPLGSSKEVHADVRIVCATNRDIGELIQKQEFREDLYYRISQIHIHIPPLRERKEDIPPLMEHFVGLANRELGTSISGIAQSAIELAMSYHWPGNVRELKNAVFRACMKRKYGNLEEEDFELLRKPKDVEPLEKLVLDALEGIREEDMKNLLPKLELAVIKVLLKRYEGNKSKVAQLLGISRNTLNFKLKEGREEPSQ